jgi:hypothetical protein
MVIGIDSRVYGIIMIILKKKIGFFWGRVLTNGKMLLPLHSQSGHGCRVLQKEMKN